MKYPPLAQLIPALAALLLLPACSSIEVGEEELFQNKPTITPADFARADSSTADSSTADSSTGGDSTGGSNALLAFTLHERTVTGAGGVRLDAWHLTQPGARGTVVYFGGNGFFLVHAKGYIEAMARYPVNLFMADYRGYGKSEGEPRVAAMRRDALALFDYATGTLGARPEATVVHGHSMGTFMAARVGQEREAAGVILENPATTAEEWTGSLMPWYLALFVRLEPSAPLREVNNLDQVAEIEEPLLIIGGAADNITDPAMARRLYDAAPEGQKQIAVIDSVGHNIPHENAAYRRVLSGFLEKVLPGGSFGAQRGK